MVLTGDKLGNVQLIELKQKIVLRSYSGEHKNQINCLDFGPNKRFFISCSNETSWKLFDIQESKGSIMTCQAAHSDNIKQVQFLPGSNDLVISAGQDKEIKLWNINLQD